jgi:hypothetical protein
MQHLIAGAGISVVRAFRPRATTGVAGRGGVAVGWAWLVKASPTTTLRVAALAAPPPSAAAISVSQTRGEETRRSGAG